MARYSYTRGTNPGTSVEVMAPGGALNAVPRRVAGEGRFGAALKGLARNPMLRAGGWALAGAPIAFDAIGQLNGDPGNTISNVSAAGGNVAGGLGGGLMGAKVGGFLGGPFAPITAPLGFVLGSQLGGGAGAGLARGLSDGVQGLVGGGAEDRAFRKEVQRAEDLARSQIAMENERTLAQMPAMQALAAFHQQQQQVEMDRMLNAQMRSLYQQGMLGPSGVPVGAYSDPNFSSALAAIASRALG
jgi:hypothetical protein